MAIVILANSLVDSGNAWDWRGRWLLTQPILLMDEPFGALDPITRAEIQLEFKKLQEKLWKTIVFVTHDVGEALMLGDRIGLMEAGQMRSVQTPEKFLQSLDTVVQEYVKVYRTAGDFFRN